MDVSGCSETSGENPSEPAETTETVTETPEGEEETPVEQTQGSEGDNNDEDNAGDDEPTINPAINDDDPDILNKIKFSMETTDGTKKEFSLSVSELLNSVYNLVNATYGEEDNDFYGVDIYEDKGYVEMYGMFTGKNYRQNYELVGDEISLVGERTEIFCMYVTEEEKSALENMQKEYSSMEKELKNYREEPDKMEILNSEEYSKVFSTKEFEELKVQKSHFELSIDEVRAKADEILLNYAKHSDFSLHSESEGKAQINSVTIPVIQKRENRYGTLFSKKG